MARWNLLDEHLKSMIGLSDADRTEQFFDFRVADIAIGVWAFSGGSH